MDKVYDYLRNIFKKKDGQRVVLANSAGPDSMSLLHVLLNLRDELNLEIIVAHVNHNIREESVKEEEFLKSFCDKNNVIFESMKILEYSDLNFQNYARNKRYEFFEKVLKKYKSKILLTAHHGDDLIETILMRLVRGSSLKGYSGFQVFSKHKDYFIYRPLIYVSKEEILEYNKNNNVQFAIDKSNYEDDYTRNRYRNHILPFLHKEDENVHQKFNKFSELLDSSFQFIDKYARNVMKKIYQDSKLDINLYKKEDFVIQKMIIFNILEEFYKEDIALISDINIDSIRSLINGSKANSSINLPGEFIAIKSYNYFYIENNENESVDYNFSLDENVKLFNGKTLSIVKEDKLNNNFVIRLDSKEIKLPLCIRNKKIGEKMELRDLGSKKIKDIFIDSKIPLKERDNYPLLVDSNDKVLWIPGVKKSKYGKKNNEYYDIIIKYV